MQIQIDSREKARAIQGILKEFDRQNVGYYTSKLYVGDYMSLDNPRLVIDRKQNLLEICSNVCQQHERFRNELVRANQAGIKLILLCEHGKNIKTLEDVIWWENPRLKKSPKATTGEQLYKSLCTIRDRYNVDIVFCTKQETGKKIIELLGSGNLDQGRN